MDRVTTDWRKSEPSYETFHNDDERMNKKKYVKSLSGEGKYRSYFSFAKTYINPFKYFSFD